MSCFHVFYGSVLNNVLQKKNLKILVEIHNNMAQVYMHYEMMQCQTTAKMIFFFIWKATVSSGCVLSGFLVAGVQECEGDYVYQTYFSLLFF